MDGAKWNEKKDVLLLREVYTIKPYKHKKSTKESGNAWSEVANKLCASKEEKFVVTAKVVRDRFAKIKEKYRAKMISEEKESGGGDHEGDEDDKPELEVLLEEILNDSASYQTVFAGEKDAVKAKEESDRTKGEDIRNVAMESFSETKKRKGDDEMKSPPGKQRRRSGDTLAFLAEKTETMKKIEEEKLKFEREKLGVRQKEAENAAKAQENQYQQMQMNMQMQQAQMQQQAAQFQQQNNLMLAMLEKLSKK